MQKANGTSGPVPAQLYPGQGGVVYVTTNSASGSKYYDITNPNSCGTKMAPVTVLTR